MGQELDERPSRVVAAALQRLVPLLVAGVDETIEHAFWLSHEGLLQSPQTPGRHHARDESIAGIEALAEILGQPLVEPELLVDAARRRAARAAGVVVDVVLELVGHGALVLAGQDEVELRGMVLHEIETPRGVNVCRDRVTRHGMIEQMDNVTGIVVENIQHMCIIQHPGVVILPASCWIKASPVQVHLRAAVSLLDQADHSSRKLKAERLTLIQTFGHLLPSRSRTAIHCAVCRPRE